MYKAWYEQDNVQIKVAIKTLKGQFIYVAQLDNSHISIKCNVLSNVNMPSDTSKIVEYNCHVYVHVHTYIQ